jgi:shikimate dehydrogenase
MFDTPASASASPPGVPRYAVFGHPVAHSRSPWIHARFAAQCRIALRYEAIDAAPAAFADALAHFAAQGGRGANVTLPLKGHAAVLCAELAPAAQRASSVNTLRLRADGRWRGDNTDGVGLVRDIAERWRRDVRGRRVLLLGAGGAAQGVVDALLDAGVDTLTIANRDPARADALADRIGEPARVHTVYWDGLADAGMFDLVVNATSAGHQGAGLNLPFALLGARSMAYDMNYGAAAVDFTAWARAAGCEDVFDGLGMLIEQAAAAFEIWHGLRPDTDEVYRALREDMARR